MPTDRGSDDWEIRASNKSFRVQTLFDVSDRVVLITGGGSGIGSMIAAGFVANNAKVYIASRKDCSALADELTLRGPGVCFALLLDVGKPDSIKACVAELQQKEPDGVGVLINNAGTNWAQPLEEYSPKGWDKVYNVNVRGVFFMIQAMLPMLELASSSKGSSRSSIINISSIDSISTPVLDTYAYSSGKAAVSHMSRVLAGKFGFLRKRINVNAICPGPFRSRMMRVTLDAVGEEALSGAVGRIGNPEDMAGVTLLLASKAGEYITGDCIVVDGGACVLPNRPAKL